MINFWTVVFLAGLSFFQEFIEELDRGRINEQQFLDKCFRIFLEHIADRFISFVNGSDDPELHLQGQAIFGMLEMLQGTANLDNSKGNMVTAFTSLQTSNLESTDKNIRSIFLI